MHLHLANELKFANFQLEQSKLPAVHKEKIIASFRRHSIGLQKLPPEIQKYATEIIKEYTIHHLDVFNLCDKLEEEFSVLVLLQFISSGGMICFILYQMYDVSASSTQKNFNTNLLF